MNNVHYVIAFMKPREYDFLSSLTCTESSMLTIVAESNSNFFLIFEWFSVSPIAILIVDFFSLL